MDDHLRLQVVRSSGLNSNSSPLHSRQCPVVGWKATQVGTVAVSAANFKSLQAVAEIH